MNTSPQCLQQSVLSGSKVLPRYRWTVIIIGLVAERFQVGAGDKRRLGVETTECDDGGAHVDIRVEQEPRCCHLEQKWWKLAVFSFLCTSSGCGHLVILSISLGPPKGDPQCGRAHLHYCNTLYSGWTSEAPSWTQDIQNAAARVLTHTSRRGHVLTVLVSLHLANVAFSLDFKVLLLTLKALHGLARVTCRTSWPHMCLLTTWADLVSAFALVHLPVSRDQVVDLLLSGRLG